MILHLLQILVPTLVGAGLCAWSYRRGHRHGVAAAPRYLLTIVRGGHTICYRVPVDTLATLATGAGFEVGASTYFIHSA